MAYAAETKALVGAHRMELDGRSRLSVTGVQDVESFDEETVVLVTVQGTMVVRGEGLHLQMLSLESGQVTVEGRVDSMTYEDDAPGGGFFARLFG
jgi:sporulation protein YabP